MFILIGLLHVLICYLYDTEIHFGKCEDDFHIKKIVVALKMKSRKICKHVNLPMNIYNSSCQFSAFENLYCKFSRLLLLRINNDNSFFFNTRPPGQNTKCLLAYS